MTLDELNLLSRVEAAIVLSRCCGSAQWAKNMSLKRPFLSEEELFTTADSIWQRLPADDWKEAFSHHPKIGDINSLRETFSSTRTWAEGEQSGARSASEETLRRLAAGNTEYEKRFGYTFIVCATGKTADEMLALLTQRLRNTPVDEIHIAAEEQRKITRLRMEKLVSS
ncbi:MAG: 2-oxo-4-hydroxy-4-carboxy-5-ureidoimidazoline decarboxylase [Bacteroidota bacterium]